MAYLIGDGFDLYAAIADAALNYWDVSSGWTLSSTSRFSTGQSLQGSSNSTTFLSKLFGGTDGTFFIACSLMCNSVGATANNAIGIQLLDGTSAQCTIVFRQDGSIALAQGGITGTVIATYSGAFIQNVWNHFQFKVVINNSTGEFHIRKNGSGSDESPTTGATTGLNTRSSANNQATKVAVVSGTAGTSSMFMDDLLVYTGAGSAPNDYVGDIRCSTQYPSSDPGSKVFSPNIASFQMANTASVDTNSATQATGTAIGLRAGQYYTPTYNGTVSKVSVYFHSSYTGNWKAAIYDNAGTLIAASNEVTNASAGFNDATFASPPALLTTKSYTLMVAGSASMTLGFVSSGAGAAQTTFSMTYASGFPSQVTFGSTSVLGSNELLANITVVPYNYTMINQAKEDGDTSYIQSANVGDNDLFPITALGSTPSSIVAVTLRAYVKKSDAGARSATVRLNSGGTTGDTGTLVLSTSYQWLSGTWTTDPHTSAAWTGTAVNALTIGPNVAA